MKKDSWETIVHLTANQECYFMQAMTLVGKNPYLQFGHILRLGLTFHISMKVKEAYFKEIINFCMEECLDSMTDNRSH